MEKNMTVGTLRIIFHVCLLLATKVASSPGLGHDSQYLASLAVILQLVYGDIWMCIIMNLLNSSNSNNWATTNLKIKSKFMWNLISQDYTTEAHCKW